MQKSTCFCAPEVLYSVIGESLWLESEHLLFGTEIVGQHLLSKTE